MAIYKQGKSNNWYIDFTSSDGRRVRQSSGTENKAAAQELHDKLKAESWRIKNVGDKPAYRWEDAVKRWLVEQSHKKSIEHDKGILRFLHTYLYGMELTAINKNVVDMVKNKKLESGVANATVNRMLAVLRAILKRCVNDWEWLDKAPYIRLMREPTKRVRWLTKEEANLLLLNLPSHIADMMRFTLATGLRESNVTRIEWSQIDMQRKVAWIHADQSKTNNGIAVPLNENAIAVLLKQIGKHSVKVFTYKGNPVDIANTKAWRAALKKSNISDFRWHDLRHTWASWHVQNGTPLHALQEMGGWSNSEMVKRYAHLSHQQLVNYADNVSVNDKLSSYPIKSPADENRRRA